MADQMSPCRIHKPLEDYPENPTPNSSFLTAHLSYAHSPHWHTPIRPDTPSWKSGSHSESLRPHIQSASLGHVSHTHACSIPPSSESHHLLSGIHTTASRLDPCLPSPSNPLSTQPGGTRGKSIPLLQALVWLPCLQRTKPQLVSPSQHCLLGILLPLALHFTL